MSLTPGQRRRPHRRTRWLRLIPLLALAAAGFAVGVLVATSRGGAERRLATAYVQAWARGDYARMYKLLDAASRHHLTEARFAAEYLSDARTATLIKVIPHQVGGLRAGVIVVPVTAVTRVFGRLRKPLILPVVQTSSGPAVRFATTLLFPGLRPGERLSRLAELAPRASILARDGTPLAEGPTRTSPIPDVASEIAGVLGPIPPDQASTYAALGYPRNAKVGLDGLERVFQLQVAGTPGGTLLAGRRMLASVAPIPGHTVTSTIDPGLESAAIRALAGRYGGIAVMDPRTGAVRALAGLAFSVLQPPGSTMKIITATAALQAGLVTLGTTFPYATSSTIEGYQLQNANGEDCGGTLLNAFAVSCNSVFAPLGARLGAQRLVSMAERFGFNQRLSIPGAAESSIPSASTIGDSLAVGSSAIGQGKVQASALEMTDVAATIAMRGQRPIPTLTAGQPPRFVPVTTAHIAGLVQRMMVAVVQFGTGTAAQIPGVKVAGKTGTAELVNTTNQNNPNAGSAQNTDAWFVGYAPVGAPRVVAGALFPNQGAGGGTAAPAIQEVLVAGLHAH
ncbi:MAG TPA: penicillin-binding transpeptidase domain-containing protein [Solirubrobacteraceae bacterium]|nr:penicillin-binding transpeptidase domain-containing protein [Solirubrobacteraceae bacterium]